ncbi:MAG: zinc transporter ZntB [Burkholderiales bacterium]|nr:zinc transporter ZntB [Burkholderiales bacterium]
MMITNTDDSGEGLVYALVLDGTGGARQLAWDEVEAWSPEQGALWLHFDYTAENSREWILGKAGLDEIATDALLAHETRPRTIANGDSALLALRGVNLNPGSDPEDMVSIRVWMDGHRIISTRKRKLLSASDIVRLLEAGKGPRSTGEFIVDLADRLTARVEGIIAEIEERVDAMEADVVAGGSQALRSALSETRRDTIMLRRYLAPQREAVIRLSSEKFSWLNEPDRRHLREVADKLIRYVEELDSVRDRASVTQEELVGKLSEQLNSRMYVLSIVAAIFLPLGFLTGLLGVNVGGVPGAGSDRGFLLFSLLLIVVLALQIWVFRKNKWL